MSTGAAGVRAFVDQLPNDAIFSRKQLVREFGSRGVVDNVLQRLCSENEIARVATGIYQKRAGASRLPSAREIIELRASAFGKQIIESEDSSTDCETFRTNGCRSSFRSIHGRLYFKPMNQGRPQSAGLPKTTITSIVLAPCVTTVARPRQSVLSLVRHWFVCIMASF